MRVCGRLNARDRAPLSAQAANLVTVYHGLAWNGEAHAVPEAWEPLRGPWTPGPQRSELAVVASDQLRWLGCAGAAPGPSRGWASLGCGSLPLSSESPHLQPGQDLPVRPASLLPTSLECCFLRLCEGMSAGSWVSCPPNCPPCPQLPSPGRVSLPAVLSRFTSYPDCVRGASIPSLKLGQRPCMSQGVTPPTTHPRAWWPSLALRKRTLLYLFWEAQGRGEAEGGGGGGG